MLRTAATELGTERLATGACSKIYNRPQEEDACSYHQSLKSQKATLWFHHATNFFLYERNYSFIMQPISLKVFLAVSSPPCYCLDAKFLVYPVRFTSFGLCQEFCYNLFRKH